MTYAEFKLACEAAGLTDTDTLWFVDFHPTGPQTMITLTLNALDAGLGYALTGRDPS